MSTIIDGSAGITFPNSTVQASAGKIVQVASGSLTGNVSTTSSSYVSTGLSVTLTPLFSTSKILIIFNNYVYVTGTAAQCNITLYKNGSNLSSSGLANVYGQTAPIIAGIGFNYIDTSVSTSSTTYTLYFQNTSNSNTVYLNNGANANTCVTQLVAMEIAQ